MATSRLERWALWRRWPRLALAAEVVLIGVLGCWLGLLAGGRLDAPVGPLQARLSLSPAWGGDSVIALPPLGELSIDSHDGPVRLGAEVTRINEADAREIFRNPGALGGLPDRVTADLRSGLARLAVQSTVAAALGSALLGVLVFRRRPRRILAATGVSVATLLLAGGVGAATWDPEAINEPEYRGLLVSAPSVVGDARSIVSDFEKYEKQLAKIVTNVSRLYDVTSTLPAYTPDPSTIRVLHVSDLHLNPTSWDIIRSIATQFEVDVIIDTGDISDHGTGAENYYVDPIGTLDVPYVFIRGNHDSLATQRAIAQQPNAIVLDGKVREVAGLRLLGVGDPRFTPDKDTRGVPPPPSVREVGEELADVARAAAGTAEAGTGLDAVLVHDPAMAAPLDGLTPLVLAGHLHRREQRRLEAGTVVFMQGSTGASGLRGLEGEKPTPVSASVLYFDRDERTLQAWDDITLGGLGLTSAKIERHLYDETFVGDLPVGVPTPQGVATEVPAPTSSTSSTTGSPSIESPSAGGANLPSRLLPPP